MNLTTRSNMSIVTMVLARHRTADVMQRLFDRGIHSALLSNARGTLIQDKWYQSLLPMISPELGMIQLAVPDPAVDSVMEHASKAGYLHRSGAGAIYCTPCDMLLTTGEFPLWPLDSAERPEQDASTHLHENLTLIYLISQGERTDAVSRAAMRVGSHGPIVQYSEGRGLRERLGWLRITSKPTKEVVCVLVDNVDADLIFSVMASAGQVDQAARGLIYRMPVQKGLVNLDSIYSETRHAASIQQIIRAIDDIKGNKDWREQDPISRIGVQAADMDFLELPTTPTPAENQALLSILSLRENTEQISKTLIEMGAPGLNMSYPQFHQAANHSGQHDELVHVRVVLPHPQATAFQQELPERLAVEMMVYVQPVSGLLTYQMPSGEKSIKTAG